MKRSLSILLIVGFWLLMMAAQWNREQKAPKLEHASLEAQLTEQTETWLVLLAGPEEDSGTNQKRLAKQKVGFVHLQQSPESRGSLAGVTHNLRTHLDLELFGRKTELDVQGETWRPFEQPLSNFEFKVQSGEFRFEVLGRIAAGELNGRVVSAGESFPLHYQVSEDLLFGSGITSSYRFPDIAVGDTVTVDIFDPLTFRKTEAEVHCLARQFITPDVTYGPSVAPIETHLLEISSSGMTTRAWVDGNGEIVRATTPLGLTLVRATAEVALASQDNNPQAGADLLGLTSIKPSGMALHRGLSHIKMSITNLAGDLPPSDAFQQVSSDGILTRNRTAANSEPLGEADHQRLLSGDAFIQVDHPTIQELALKLTAATQDETKKAEALFSYVYETIDKSSTLSIPSAIEVLEHKRGDCNEHTVLFTALSRAVGIPTRIAIGLVWRDELDGFYYHAWPEVYVQDATTTGAGWLAVDPTLGQIRADASHIKLLEGGIETWTRLLPFLGSLEIEILQTTS